MRVFRMALDLVRVEAAKMILSGPSCLLYKTCRAGATTSLAVAAGELKKSMLLIAPTNAIIDKTLRRASKQEPVKIAANVACYKWKEAIREDRFLVNLPLPIQNCGECEYYPNCEVTEILRFNRKPGTAINFGITYHKLTAVMLAKSDASKAIRDKLRGLDAIVLDEAHSIGLHQPPRVPIFSYPEIPEDFTTLNRVLAAFQDQCHQSIEIISELLTEGNKGHIGKHLSRSAPIQDQISFKILAAAHNELIALTSKRNELSISEESILLLRDICSIMGGAWCTFGYVSEREVGRIYLTGNVGTLYYALSDFLNPRERTTKIFTSGTLLEPYPGFFKNLAGCHLVDIVFPEANLASLKMRIISDKWTLDSKSFNRRLNEIVSRIEAICNEVWPEKCYVIAPNVAASKLIKKKLSKLTFDKVERPDVDYYRSEHTIGVERGERVCIAVGLAHIPSNACDHLAIGKSHEERAISSAAIRIQSVHAASWQAWNRVKDPNGEHESRVYCIGIRARQVLDVATWGSNRRLELIKTTENTYGESAETTKKAKGYRFDVVVNYALDMPKIQAEPRADKRAARIRLDEMIMDVLSPDEVLSAKAIAKDNENIIKAAKGKLGLSNILAPSTENLANTLYIFYRVFAGKVVHHVNVYHGILSGYNEGRDRVAAFLALYFCHRTDCYAVQMYNKLQDKWVYYPKDGCLNDYNLELITAHLRADEIGLDRRFTMGVYQIDPKTDTVSWICFDLDRHNLEDPDPKESVQRILAVLGSYCVPYLLESSGSPDSYHVWVFLVPTKTNNAYEFSRWIERSAKVKCEIWPKQRGYSDRRGKDYGNLVKLPLAYHNKTGQRSIFLDPVTFEPMEYVQLPGLVRLFEYPIGTKAKERSQQKKPTQSNSEYPEFRSCLKAILESQNSLEGADGNEMRVVIGTEAKCSELTLDEAVKLFQNLPDFNEAITRNYLEYIYRGPYKRYRCDKILDKASSLISPYCRKCKLPWAAENVKNMSSG
jgi:hypothetical protein